MVSTVRNSGSYHLLGQALVKPDTVDLLSIKVICINYGEYNCWKKQKILIWFMGFSGRKGICSSLLLNNSIFTRAIQGRNTFDLFLKLAHLARPVTQKSKTSHDVLFYLIVSIGPTRSNKQKPFRCLHWCASCLKLLLALQLMSSLQNTDRHQ